MPVHEVSWSNYARAVYVHVCSPCSLPLYFLSPSMLSPSILSLSLHPLVGDNELHCPKCRVVTYLQSGGVANLPINYALKEVAEALEDEISPSPPSSLGHTSRQVSGKLKVVCDL